MESILPTVLTAGFAGGVLRGLVGYIKYRSSYKSTPFVASYFALTVLVSGVVGLVAAWVTEDLGISFLGLTSVTPALAMVLGYAGGDFIENLFKIITGKGSLYEFRFLRK